MGFAGNSAGTFEKFSRPGNLPALPGKFPEFDSAGSHLRIAVVNHPKANNRRLKKLTTFMKV